MKRLRAIGFMLCVVIVVALCVLIFGATKHPVVWDSVRSGVKKSDVYSTIGPPEFHSETGYDEWKKSTVAGFWRLRVFYHAHEETGSQSNLVVAVIERSFKWRIP